MLGKPGLVEMLLVVGAPGRSWCIINEFEPEKSLERGTCYGSCCRWDGYAGTGSRTDSAGLGIGCGSTLDYSLNNNSELYSVALQPPAPCIRAYPNRGPGTAMTEPRLMTKGERPGKVKVKVWNPNPAAWVVESDETSSDFESGDSLIIWFPACEAESVDAKPLANLGAGDDAIP